MRSGFFYRVLYFLLPTPILGAFKRKWILPRAKKYATGIFLPTKSCRPPSSNPNTIKKRLTANAVRRFFGRSVGIRTRGLLDPNRRTMRYVGLRLSPRIRITGDGKRLDTTNFLMFSTQLLYHKSVPKASRI